MSKHNCPSGVICKAVAIVCGLLAIHAICVIYWIYKPNQITMQKSIPATIEAALKRVETDVGKPESQREDIEKISEALKSGQVTSEQLGKKGDWVHFLMRRCDVREAKIAYSHIVSLSELVEREPLKRWQLDEAEELFKKVSCQIDSTFAKEEGLKATHVSLWRVMYKVRNGGENPP